MTIINNYIKHTICPKCKLINEPPYYCMCHWKRIYCINTPVEGDEVFESTTLHLYTPTGKLKKRTKKEHEAFQALE